MKVIHDGYVCSDCIFMMANGEIDPDASEERIQEVAAATTGWCSAEDDDHPDHEFSWSPCATCRSPLGGQRHWAVMLAHDDAEPVA